MFNVVVAYDGYESEMGEYNSVDDELFAYFTNLLATSRSYYTTTTVWFE